jgi:hypothetical protein
MWGARWGGDVLLDLRIIAVKHPDLALLAALALSSQLGGTTGVS